jgi:hypothetical protein
MIKMEKRKAVDQPLQRTTSSTRVGDMIRMKKKSGRPTATGKRKAVDQPLQRTTSSTRVGDMIRMKKKSGRPTATTNIKR